MEIIFVRHGQSEYNKNNVFTGWHDPGITDVGKEQAVNTAKKIENELDYPGEIKISIIRETRASSVAR